MRASDPQGGAGYPGAERGSHVMARTELTDHCPQYERAAEILGGRWTGLIVRSLLAGRTRFSEFTATIPGLSDRLCSERL
ncbi:MAG: winged helix-turn-helix transcriptional regulator, partial [Acidimicrobiia bacterium]